MVKAGRGRLTAAITTALGPFGSRRWPTERDRGPSPVHRISYPPSSARCMSTFIYVCLRCWRVYGRRGLDGRRGSSGLSGDLLALESTETPLRVSRDLCTQPRSTADSDLASAERDTVTAAAAFALRVTTARVALGPSYCLAIRQCEQAFSSSVGMRREARIRGPAGCPTEFREWLDEVAVVGVQ